MTFNLFFFCCLSGVVDRRNKRNILVNGDGFGVAWYVSILFYCLVHIQYEYAHSNLLFSRACKHQKCFTSSYLNGATNCYVDDPSSPIIFTFLTFHFLYYFEGMALTQPEVVVYLNLSLQLGRIIT